MYDKQRHLDYLKDLYQSLKNGEIVNEDGISLFDLTVEINCIQFQIEHSKAIKGIPDYYYGE